MRETERGRSRESRIGCTKCGAVRSTAVRRSARERDAEGGDRTHGSSDSAGGSGTIQTTTFVWRIVTRRAILRYTRRGTERRQERDKTTSKWLFEARKGYKINRRVEDSRELVIVRGETGNSVKLESETKLSYFICATVRSFYMIFE